MENFSKKQKMLSFVKRYAYLFLLVVGAVVLIVAVALTSNKKEQGEVVDVNASRYTLAMPILDATVTKGFSDSALQWNSTLGQYEAHMGIDFYANAGTSVYSVLDGKVKSVEKNYLDGNTVTIEHGNGMVSVYSSLDDDIPVNVGDSVMKGDVIGKVGNTAGRELEMGNHLHFQLLEGDKKIDPAGYLNLENK